MGDDGKVVLDRDSYDGKSAGFIKWINVLAVVSEPSLVKILHFSVRLHSCLIVI